MVPYVDAVVAMTNACTIVLHVCLLRGCDGARLRCGECMACVWVVHVVQALCLAQLTFCG